MNIYYLHFFLVTHYIFCNCKNSECCKYKRHNIDKAENDEYDKSDNNEFKKKYDNKKNNIIEKNAYFNWFKNNCGLQTVILTLFNIFKNNQKTLEIFKNSNRKLYKNLYSGIFDYNKFEENDNKNNSNEILIDIYVEILKFFKSKVVEIKNKMNNEYWKYDFLYDNNENYSYKKDYNGTNDNEKVIFNEFHELDKNFDEYMWFIDHIVNIEEKYIPNDISSIFQRSFLDNLLHISSLDNINKIFNKEGHKKLIEYINKIFENIEKYKNEIDCTLRIIDIIFIFEEIFHDFIKEKINNNNIYKYNIENETITFEIISDRNDDNLENNNFKKSELLNSDFENMFFITLYCSHKEESIDHVSCIYKDNNGNWWLNGGFNKIIKVDPELIKQQNFKQIMDNYSHIMNYKFVGIDYIIFKNNI